MDVLFKEDGIVYCRSEEEFDRKWSKFLKKVESLQKFHGYCINRVKCLIKNGVVQPLIDYGLNPNWTNNNAESINHVLKQGTDWKKKTLLQLIAILETLSKLQDCNMKGVLFGIGDFALVKSWKGYGISQNIWNNMTPNAQRRKLTHFWLHGQGAVTKVVHSSDGKLRVNANPSSGKKKRSKVSSKI